MARTIIDILRKGNQELFHSSMIAWLLDPNGEHGLHDYIYRKLATLLYEKGINELSDLRTDHKIGGVQTEFSDRRFRYDIMLTFNNGKRLVIENKTKSFGSKVQMNEYKNKNKDIIAVVGLGLTDLSFVAPDADELLIITYSDILRILETIEIATDISDPFLLLIDQYRTYLSQEMKIIDHIDCYFSEADPEKQSRLCNIDQQHLIGDNDRRFYNLYFLRRFERYIKANARWTDFRWDFDKNMISGTWMANSSKSDAYIFNLADCGKSFDEVWFHIELKDGIFAHEDKSVGTIQLKCGIKDDKSKLLQVIKNKFANEQSLRFPKGIREKSATYYLASSDLSIRDLTAPNLFEKLDNFAHFFGDWIENK